MAVGYHSCSWLPGCNSAKKIAALQLCWCISIMYHIALWNTDAGLLQAPCRQCKHTTLPFSLLALVCTSVKFLPFNIEKFLQYFFCLRVCFPPPFPNRQNGSSANFHSCNPHYIRTVLALTFGPPPGRVNGQASSGTNTPTITAPPHTHTHCQHHHQLTPTSIPYPEGSPLLSGSFALRQTSLVANQMPIWPPSLPLSLALSVSVFPSLHGFEGHCHWLNVESCRVL